MKRFAAILLTALILFSFAACDFTDQSQCDSENSTSTDNKENNTSDTDNTPTINPSFITQEEKNTWRDKLVNVLSNCEIFGSFAVGLMDLNFDNSPEVMIAYPGGSIGNVFTMFYELDTGDQLFIYNADHWDSDNNINLCVAKDSNGDLVTISEGYLRGVGEGFIKHIRVFPKYVDFNAHSLYANNFLSETTDSDSPKCYYYKDQEVDKSEYDSHANDYQRIDSTQIQLVTHEIIGKDSEINTNPDSRKEFAEEMADSLINNSQEFIDCKAAGITMGKYPYVPKMYYPILDAYYKMDNYKKTTGSTEGIVATDYPELSEANFNALLDYTKEFSSYGRGYFLYDINLDGTDEMVFSCWGGGTSSQYYIEMIFTGDGNEVKFIGRFEDNDYKYLTEIGDDGRIHCSVTGKGEKGVTHHVVSFDKSGASEIFSYGISDLRDYFDYPCELEWLKSENGEWINITEEEYTAIEETYAFNEINGGFEFRYFIKFAPK